MDADVHPIESTRSYAFDLVGVFKKMEKTGEAYFFLADPDEPEVPYVEVEWPPILY